MHTLLKLKNARKVVKLLGEVGPGMDVLVLYDLYAAHNAEAVGIAVTEAEGRLTMMQMAAGAHHGGELPAPVAAAMKASDLIIGVTRFNIAHTSARREAQLAGAKVISLPESDSEGFFLARGWDCDFVGLRREVEALADALTGADTARVRSDLGTDITMSIAGRKGRALHGFANTEDISAGYCLEASLAPVEGTAQGRIVVNASIPGIALIEKAPVEITFENGYAVAIEGGPEAETFRSLLESFDDPQVYNLGELGVGMNPMCRLDGTMLSDESVYGALQLALGTSAYIGGTVKAAAHYDTIVTDAVLELDGAPVLEGDKLLLDV
jgi:leucyl aminopeptidase (aminopeptidase T)